MAGVRIPRYEQQTLATGHINARANPDRVIPALNLLPNAVGQGIESLGAAIGGVSRDIMAIDNNDAVTRSAKTLETAKLEWRDNLNQRKKGPNADSPEFAKTFDSDFSKWAEDAVNNEPNAKGKIMLREGLGSLRDSLGLHALDFQEKVGQAKVEANLDSAYEKAATTLYSDPSQYDSARKTLMTAIANLEMDPAKKLDLAKKYGDRLAEVSARGAINNDASAAYGHLKGAPRVAPGFEGAVGFTLRHEGGLNPSDSNGSPSLYGINKAAHPSVDFSKLTPEGAQAIYKKEYWDWIGGDKLAAKNPQLALVAFDTAVLNKEKAKQFLKEADGDPVKFMELREQFLGKLLKNDPEKYGKYAHTWAERNRELRNNLLPDGTPPVSGVSYFDALPIERRLVLEGMAHTRVNQNQAIMKEDVSRRMTDATEMAKDGIVDPRPISRQEFVAAYGETDGARQHGIYVGNQQMASDINNMRSMTTEEIGASLEASKPKAGAGYATEDARFKIKAQAAAQVLKLREDDPATFVLKSSEPVGTAYRNMQAVLGDAQSSAEQRQRAAQSYAAASIAEQQRLGIGNPRLLSKAYTDSVQQQFAASTAGEPVAQKVQALASMWGNYWPTVYKQLISEKALPPAAIVIGSGMTGAAAADMAMASKFKDDELLIGRPDPKTDKKDITEKVTSQLEEFRSTMVGSDGNPRTVGGVDTYNTFHAQTEKLATYYVSQGMGIPDAAKKAANETVLARYNFVDQYGPYRIPKTEDVSKVTDGAHYAIVNISPDEIAMPETLRKDSFVRSDVAKSIKRKGYWVTAPDESGLVLFHADTRAPVLRADGRPFQYTWQQLSSMDEDGKINGAR